MKISLLVRVLASLILTLCLVRSSGAQVRGVVSSPAGAPLPEVTVELWGPNARLASTLTDSLGRFVLPARDSQPLSGLVARRIGYTPLSVPLPSDRSDIRLTMEAVAATLPVVVTTAVTKLCPNQDQPAARALWHTVRRRYLLPPYRYGMAWNGLTDSADVRASEIGSMNEFGRRRMSTSIGAAQRLADSARIADEGYAIAYYTKASRASGSSRPARHWHYARLDSYMAQHFLDASFGEAHSLSFGPGDGGAALTIAYCTRSRKQPSISGTLRVGPDRSLAAATWMFRTPSPDDAAGGEVVFAPPRRDTAVSLLLPAQSTVWRHAPGDGPLYSQRVTEFSGWALEDTVLPVPTDRMIRVDSTAGRLSRPTPPAKPPR